MTGRLLSMLCCWTISYFTMVNAQEVTNLERGNFEKRSESVMENEQQQKSKSDHRTPDASRHSPIDELFKCSINGTEQWLLCRGNDQSKPIVLFVHGGPGYPTMWFSRGFDDPYLNEFVVVHWDQRNSGKSVSPEMPIEACTLSQIVNDGLKVTGHLKQKFGVKKILLVGHSWGTMVAANMAAQKPTDFSAVVLVGTCANWRRGEEQRYQLIMNMALKKDDKESAAELRKLGPPPHTNAIDVERFGELFARIYGFKGTSRKLGEAQLAEAILKNQEYSDDEIVKALQSMKLQLNHLGKFLNTYVLQDEVHKLDLPVHFVQGEHDMNTPTDLARSYFDLLIAPQGKRWHLFKDVAHLPMYEETNRFVDLLKKINAGGS